MRRAIATLGVFVVVGIQTAGVWAQQARAGHTARSGVAGRVEARETQEKRACVELPELRHELLRLQQELRRLEAALAEAKASGNRDRVQQIMQEIRVVKAQIQEVQHKIRRLLEVCAG